MMEKVLEVPFSGSGAVSGGFELNFETIKNPY